MPVSLSECKSEILVCIERYNCHITVKYHYPCEWYELRKGDSKYECKIILRTIYTMQPKEDDFCVKFAVII